MHVVTYAAAENGRQGLELARGENPERVSPAALADLSGVRNDLDASLEPPVDVPAPNTGTCARTRADDVSGSSRKRKSGGSPTGIFASLRNLRDDLDRDSDSGSSVDPVQ